MTISNIAERIVREVAEREGCPPSSVAVWMGDPSLCDEIADASGASRRNRAHPHPLNRIQAVLKALDRDRGRWDKSYIRARSGHRHGGTAERIYRAYRLRAA